MYIFQKWGISGEGKGGGDSVWSKSENEKRKKKQTQDPVPSCLSMRGIKKKAEITTHVTRSYER